MIYVSRLIVEKTNTKAHLGKYVKEFTVYGENTPPPVVMVERLMVFCCLSKLTHRPFVGVILIVDLGHGPRWRSDGAERYASSCYWTTAQIEGKV
jgi:hypothetical protein